jgi:nucleotide-binding universal stress UspA family protein
MRSSSASICLARRALRSAGRPNSQERLVRICSRFMRSMYRRPTILSSEWRRVPIDASAMDEVYRGAIQAVFDSVQPDPGWRLSFSGEPGPVLVAESGAALLVVGTRGHVGIGRLLSGSVSHYCLSHADCPVVAVPARDHGADKDHDHAAADTSAAT